MFCIYSCNASVQKKNAAGHSALDLAVAAGDNKVISLFQGSLDREHWTNLWDRGTLFSSTCYYNKLFPQIKVLWLCEHLITCVQFCLQNPWPCVISLGLVTVKYFLQDSSIPFQQFRAQFLSDCTLFCKFSFPFQTKGQTRPSQAQINLSDSEMSIMPDEHCLRESDTWATALQAVIDYVIDELIFLFDVKTAFSGAHCSKSQDSCPPENWVKRLCCSAFNFYL